MNSIKIDVSVKGIRPIMFDRFVSMKMELSPMEKAYVVDNKLVFPAKNIMSFLSAQTTESSPKRLMGRKWKTIAKAALSYVTIEPYNIFFLDDKNKTIDADSSQIEIHVDNSKIKNGVLIVPQEKHRPVLNLPWNLKFELTLFENPDLNEAVLRRLFEEGGIPIGFGTYRGLYGKFIVQKWVHKSE